MLVACSMLGFAVPDVTCRLGVRGLQVVMLLAAI